MRVLILDGYNLMHRARFGFGEGEYSTIYNFFRGLRPLVEKFTPKEIYFVLEGYPKHNKEILPVYKANRAASSDDFRRQRVIIEEIMRECLPVTSIRHEDYECDDVLYSIAKNWHANDDVIVVSSDSDFIQLYEDCKELTLWHPIQKKVVPAPEYDYVLWKSLRGDKTDNIPGIKGVGDKTAEMLVNNPCVLADRMKNEDFARQLKMNQRLIKLEDLGIEKLKECKVYRGKSDWAQLKKRFDEFSFESMTNKKAWKKFIDTFEKVNKS